MSHISFLSEDISKLFVNLPHKFFKISWVQDIIYESIKFSRKKKNEISYIPKWFNEKYKVSN